MIKRYLDDLENRIDPTVEEQLLSEWKSFLTGNLTSGLFVPQRSECRPSRLQSPVVSINEAIDDRERMALQQLSGCSAAIAGGSGAIMNVRANYGTGILSSVFGADIFRMDNALNTLPTTKPLEGGGDAVRRILEADPPDLTNGYGGSCLETGAYFVKLFKDYPRISKYVHIYHPDLQGPMDVAELLWGSGIFFALVDTPDLVHAFLQRITETYRRFMIRWDEIAPGPRDYSAHWGFLHRGRIVIRDDSAMNLSPDMFETFIKPYDQQLMTEFDGGAIHFCGRGDHFIHHIAGISGVYAVAMSQPEYNEMEHIYRHTVDKGIALIGFSRSAAESALNQGRDLRGKVHCW